MEGRVWEERGWKLEEWAKCIMPDYLALHEKRLRLD